MIMPQCHTQAEVFEQFARVSRLIEGTNLAIWGMYKFNGERGKVHWNPLLAVKASNYSFALAIVEGKPVFSGDKLWCLSPKQYVEISGIENTKYLLTVQTTENGFLEGSNCLIDRLTWQEPKRTFTLNGEELPLPDDTHGRSNTVRGAYYLPEDAFTHFRWDNVDARDKVQAAILKLLNGGGERNKR